MRVRECFVRKVRCLAGVGTTQRGEERLHHGGRGHGRLTDRTVPDRRLKQSGVKRRRGEPERRASGALKPTPVGPRERSHRVIVRDRNRDRSEGGIYASRRHNNRDDGKAKSGRSLPSEVREGARSAEKRELTFDRNLRRAPTWTTKWAEGRDGSQIILQIPRPNKKPRTGS